MTNNIKKAVYLGDWMVVMSARPWHIKRGYSITMPHPRSYTDPAFLAYRSQISAETDLVL